MRNKSIGFIVVSTIAGFLSGISDVTTFAIRGAIFGGVLAIGMLACAVWHETKGRLSVWATLVAAGVVSLVSTPLMEGVWMMFPEGNLMDAPDRIPVYTFLTGFLIAWGMFLRYRSYTLKQWRLVKVLFFLGIPALSVLPRAVLFYEPGGELPIDIPAASILCFLYGLLPFLLLWGGVTRWYGFFRKETHEETDVNPEPSVSETERSGT